MVHISDVKNGCKDCVYKVDEGSELVCGFPLIPEMFVDGIIDENPTNMSNGGVDCKRYKSKLINQASVIGMDNYMKETRRHASTNKSSTESAYNIGSNR